MRPNKPGRLLRAIMRDNANETPQRARERVLAREVGKQAHADMLAKFAPLTAENARDAIAFQEQRAAELLRERAT